MRKDFKAARLEDWKTKPLVATKSTATAINN